MAVEAQNEEQLRDIAAGPKTEAVVRAWANIKRAELLYNRSQQEESFLEDASREELLGQAINCHKQALQIGQKWREVVGQATIGLGLCYENLGQLERAAQQYEAIISEGTERFKGTLWLSRAQGRKKFLAGPAEEKVVFGP